MGFNGLVSSTMEGNALQLNGIRVSPHQPLKTPHRAWMREGLFPEQMQLQLAVGELPPDSPVRPRFTGLLQMVGRVIEHGRVAIQGLRTPQQHVPSLGQALASVPNELDLQSNVQFRVVVRGFERELKPLLGAEVYGVLREAIVNAYSHSGAKDIEAEIEYRSSELRVAVRDNGCGIDPQDLQRKQNGHWGLQGMRERADRIGARLKVLSRTALGTEVELRIPGDTAFERIGSRT